jgi:hypothetical protein
MVGLDAARIRDALARLRAAQAPIFGANYHQFLLNPPLAEADVLAFERLHKVFLPADYRHFLTTIGDGGAGPYYGIFPLGEMDNDRSLKAWQEQDDLIGVISEPFSLETEWNDLTGMPSTKLLEADGAEYERQLDEFEKRYWSSSLMHGAVPICHEGCALRIWLVLTGLQAGRLWHDGRSELTGVKPLRLADGSHATFSLWYSEWLEQALRASRATG